MRCALTVASKCQVSDIMPTDKTEGEESGLSFTGLIACMFLSVPGHISQCEYHVQLEKLEYLGFLNA